MRAEVLALALLTGACAVSPGQVRDILTNDYSPSVFSYAPLDGQDEAIQKVMALYGTPGPAPTIAWVEKLDCEDGYLLGGACSRGSYMDGHANVYLARIYDWYTPLALAHELAHLHQYRTIGKATHNAPWFIDNDEWQPCEKIQKATKVIEGIFSFTKGEVAN